MPIYEYQCVACDEQFDRMLPITCYKDPQDCPECGGATKRLVSAVNFNLVGDGWASKNGRIKNQMAEKNRRLDAKQEEQRRDAPGLVLAPNVEGERVDSWSEAASLAKSKGKDASGYKKRARKEKAGG